MISSQRLLSPLASASINTTYGSGAGAVVQQPRTLIRFDNSYGAPRPGMNWTRSVAAAVSCSTWSVGYEILFVTTVVPYLPTPCQNSTGKVVLKNIEFE